MNLNRSYKYRLYPSEQDKEELGKHLDLCRQVYNHFLEELNEAKETTVSLRTTEAAAADS